MKTMADPARSLAERFTYGDYRLWPEGESWELIEGQAWEMSPAPSTRHQRLARRLFSRIANFLEGKTCEPFIAPFDVLLPAGDEEDDEVDTVVQPDIAVICDRSKITERGARGAPDWIIEILSPRTMKKDISEKYRIYENRGVREYWIVDPFARVVHAWRLGDKGIFGEERIYEEADGMESSVLPGLVIEGKTLFAEPY
jgi:Uma2 family endonuclease